MQACVADGHKLAECEPTMLNPTARWLNANVAWGQHPINIGLVEGEQ